MLRKYLLQRCLSMSRTASFAWMPFKDVKLNEKMIVNTKSLYGFDSKTNLEYLSLLNINAKTHSLRMSSIICTIGPASVDVDKLEKLMENGMNIARLNFSHGSHDYHSNTVKNIRKAVENYSRKIDTYYPLGIALDTKGPEIRTGMLDGVGDGSKEVELNQGEKIRLWTDTKYEKIGTNKDLYVDYPNITKFVKEGNIIYVDDGLLLLTAKEVAKNYIDCVIENNAMLGSRKGVNLPGLDVDLPAVSEKDKVDLLFAVEHDLDIIFASFIREASGVQEIRKILGECGKDILIVPKIENEQGIHNLQSIINVSDGIMVARGDLGIEIPEEKVFIAQKSILAQCNEAGKPGICATQMMESMINKPRPTRAEASDVANAVMDGADCVMLSGETAKGKYPVECIRTMDKICREAESVIWLENVYSNLISHIHPLDKPQRIGMTVVKKANELNAAAIIVISKNMILAQKIAKFRPRNVILVVTSDCRVARQCHLYRGILPVLYLPAKQEDRHILDDLSINQKTNAIDFTVKFAKCHGILKSRDNVVIVTGGPKDSYDFTANIEDSCIM